MSSDRKTTAQPLPVIRISGDPRQRGRQYGQQAGDRIHRSRDAYEGVYKHYALWSWNEAREKATAFLAPIDDFGTQYLEEMRGIAEGCGLQLLDIVAMNLRTEILFAAKAASVVATLPRVSECTSLSLLEPDGTRIVAQNWDWLTFAADTVIVLECDPDVGPRWTTVVEAGLLAKMGLNSAGIAVATNALVTSRDLGEPGVPYHVMLRALLESTSLVEAMNRLQHHSRSSSANYLVADHHGLAFDAECRPGDFSEIAWGTPDADGTLIHANHFSIAQLSSLRIADVGIATMPDTLLRYQRAQRSIAQSRSNGRDWREILVDHAGYPDSICCHPQPGAPAEEEWMTVVGVVLDPTRAKLEVSLGNPCCGLWSTHDYAGLWGSRASTASAASTSSTAEALPE
ncbi:MAG: C45 family autoproteolytic acyltransferase/hydrolase [Microbacteriaceae bacterium]